MSGLTKTEEKVVAEAIESLRSGRTIEQVLGAVAYEHGRPARNVVASELRKLAIKGYRDAA